MLDPNYRSISSCILFILFFFLFVNAASAQTTNGDLAMTLDISENECGYDVGCHDDNGWITLEVEGGTEPYTINWTGPNGYVSNTEDIFNLAAGEYCVEVVDAISSTIETCVVLIHDDTPPVWDFNCEYQLALYGCPGEAQISISTGDVVDIADIWTVDGQPVPGLENCVMDDCTKGTDLVITVTNVSTQIDECEATITVSFEAEDECGNVAPGITLTYIITDNTAPEPPIVADLEFECVLDIIPANEDTLIAQDACQGPLAATAVDTDNGGSGCEDDPLVITRTWTWSDGCGHETSISQTITVIAPPSPPPCDECKGGVVMLELQFNGNSPAFVEVTGEDGSPIYFSGMVFPEDIFNFIGTGPDNKLDKNTEIYVYGQLEEQIHTSCSVPIGPGAIFGDFEVISADSKDNGPICPAGMDCDCDGGTTFLEVVYNGTVSGHLEVSDKNDVYYDGPLQPGQTITLTPLPGDNKLKNNLDFEIDGVLNADVHTSCSYPIYVGLIFGDFEITTGTSRNNGDFCEPETNATCSCPEAEPECQECDGGTILLELQFNGTSSANVVIKDGGSVYFNGSASPGDILSLVPLPGDHKLKNSLDLIVNGTVQGDIHTSCSVPIGPGMVVGDFTITKAVSRNNGPMCPVEDIPEQDADCECAGGTARLDIKFTGNNIIDLTVRDGNNIFFDGTVSPGDTIILLPLPGANRLKNNLDFFVDGQEAAYVHTSCSNPIFIGMTFGDFEITYGASRNNGPFCGAGDPNPGDPDEPTDPDDPDNPTDCAECDGDLIAFDLEYNGPSAFVEITDDHQHTTYFSGNVAPGDIIHIEDASGLDNHIDVFIDGHKEKKIHAHCSGGASVPLVPGLVIGHLTIVYSESEAGPICTPETENDPEGCNACQGDLVAFTFQHNGPAALVEVMNNHKDVTYFSGQLSTFEAFSIDGSLTGGVLDRHLQVFINGHKDKKIHAHCSGGGSVPLGPGQVIGYLEVLSSESSIGGELCPINQGIIPNPITNASAGAETNSDNAVELNTEIINTIYPNPFFERATLDFVLPKMALTRVEIVDINGTLIKVEDFGMLDEGMTHTLDLTPNDNLTAGAYVYRIISGNKIATGKMILIK